MGELARQLSGASAQARLTVVMSCYNQAGYIRQAIESFLMQAVPFPVRLIITDDHSTKDNSVEIIREYAQRYPDRITALLNGENGRYFQNVLRAMALVKSEYYTLLDADDYWTDPHYLADAIAYLDAHVDHTVYFRNVAWEDGAGGHGTQVAEKERDFDISFADFVGGRLIFPQTTGAVFRNVIFREGVPEALASIIGTIHERAFDGDVFRFLAHLHKGKAHFVNRIAGVYRLSPGGVFIGMSECKRAMVQARCYIDYWRYFDSKHEFFLRLSRKAYLQAVSSWPEGDVGVDDETLLSRASVEEVLLPEAETMREHLAAVRADGRLAQNGLICYTYNDGKAEPGYYAPQIMNIGDYVQSLAARQFLPSVETYVDRDQLGVYAGGPVNMIMNAWYRFWDKCRSFSEQIRPLLVAIHINNPEDVTSETLDYFKRHEPVGCRDYFTRDFLVSKGIRAYFSGCLTLTLGRSYRVADGERTDDIYFVDYKLGENAQIDGAIRPILNARKHSARCYYRTHYYPLGAEPEAGLREAEALVREYARAGLVITRNIHCAFPCLALGIPVIFVVPKFDETRFKGLANFFNYVGVDGEGNFVSRIDVDSRGRVRNPDRHLLYAAYLERLGETFGGSMSFAGLAPACPAVVERTCYAEAEAETGRWRRVYRKRKLGSLREITLFNRLQFRYERKKGNA